MKALEITDSEMMEIKNIIEQNDNVLLHKLIELFPSNYWLLSDDSSTELRIKNFYNKQLIISRIALENQRKGTGTKILEILKQYCKTHNIPEIIMEATCTSAVNKFCLKNGFKPVLSQVYENNGELFGNYKLDVSKEK